MYDLFWKVSLTSLAINHDYDDDNNSTNKKINDNNVIIEFDMDDTSMQSQETDSTVNGDGGQDDHHELGAI